MLRDLAEEQGFVTPPWDQINPFWRLSMLLGSISLGWGLNDMLGHHSSDGIWPLTVGVIGTIVGTAVIEYLFSEEKDEPVAPNAKRPPSSNSSDD